MTSILVSMSVLPFLLSPMCKISQVKKKKKFFLVIIETSPHKVTKENINFWKRGV